MTYQIGTEVTVGQGGQSYWVVTEPFLDRVRDKSCYVLENSDGEQKICYMHEMKLKGATE